MKFLYETEISFNDNVMIMFLTNIFHQYLPVYWFFC
jgi:hypothetical protein